MFTAIHFSARITSRKHLNASNTSEQHELSFLQRGADIVTSDTAEKVFCAASASVCRGRKEESNAHLFGHRYFLSTNAIYYLP